MIYPNFISKGNIIGVCAPSDGVSEIPKINRLNYAIDNFKSLGFLVKETSSVRQSINGKSNDSKIQAQELESLYSDKEVSAIICVGGGDFLLEMLSFVDFDKIKNNVKWLQGYSDPTGLLFIITTNLDIATLYSHNFTAYGMNPWHESLINSHEILKGNIVEQNSFIKYESGHTKYVTGDESYVLDKDVLWENLNGEDKIEMEGRIIGGCIDILTELFGTRFDNTKEFIERYKNDGIIWYFDNCELTSECLIRTLWKFKDNGWFKYTKGIIFGRSALESSYYDISFKDAIKHSLSELNVPIIVNADIGHVAPQMTIINGAIVNIKSLYGKGKVSFSLK
ncbi:MAG: LD-carboxypeptidase [Bacilli bacterium]|jgi:muramoyltetrapeptide carboxypeptidase|nr:LD-carboxypeptidase [Bacilli bacterium]MCX4253812.1 LD-carboxypeptidase [Bacilli bacterium]